jgi:hypothetical protein
MYVWRFESHVQIANQCAPWKMLYVAENFVLQVLQYQQMVVGRKLPGGASISHYTPNECLMEGQFNVSA